MYGLWILLILILVSSLPVIAVYVWFRLAKYQFYLIRFLFALLAGAAAFFPALILQSILNFSLSASGRAALLYYVFVRIALTEELSRLLMLFIFFWISSRLKPQTDFSRPLSYNVIKKGTATGLVAGLGFSILESAVYAASDISVLLLRVVTAALHAACGSRIGAAAVLFRSNPIQALFRVLAAVAIHGVYNFMVVIPGFLPSIAAVLIALSALSTSILTIRGGWVEDQSSAAAPQGLPTGFKS
ncbi:MAG: PrsW family intramembrane metalloprotease [Treponema sp.]|jgi:RsiW-degrading membrane proteinase PrsW (M82 family)|nr:PrsW family intramembrane metalloprotease [Treponema sp.]